MASPPSIAALPRSSLPLLIGLCLIAAALPATGQQVTGQGPIAGAAQAPQQPIGSDGVAISADYQETAQGVSKARGSVMVRTGGIIVTAEEADYNEATGELEARGNVRYRNLNGKEDLFADKVAYNARTELGTFYAVHGTVSSASQAGARILTTDNPFYIDGRIVHKTGETYMVLNGTVTNCSPGDMWWKMTAPKTKITPGKSATVHRGVLRLKGVPLLYLPVFKKSLERLPRRSGFLTPNIGNSSRFGFVLGQSYFWAINRSYDATVGATLYSDRGVANQMSFRGRPTRTSSFDAVFFGVKDRGLKLDDGSRLKQGGANFSLKGQAMFAGGFRGVADVTYLSSLEFRQAFTQTFEEAAASQVRSIGFITKNFSTYSFNAAMSREENFQSREKDDTVVIRRLPSFEFNSRDKRIAKGRIPLYFSFDSAFGLLSRSQPAFETRNFVQRVDFFPRVSTKFAWKGFHVTPTFGARVTGYGQQREGDRIIGQDFYRQSAEFSLDIAPPALGRVFNAPKWLATKLKHVIEPRLRYRYAIGIDDFDAVVRFDYRDILSNTNEAEVSLIQRLYAKSADGSTREIMSLEIWQRRYFDSDFGGAIVPGRRNVLRSSLDVTPFAFLDQARSYSPVVMALRGNPTRRAGLEWRTDYDPLREKIVNSSIAFNYQFSSLIRTAIGHSAVRTPTTLSPSVNQLSTFIGIGDFNRRGWNAGINSIYDYRRKIFLYTVSQVSYNTDCCGFGLEYRRTGYGPAVNNDNQFRVSLSIANVGSFGTLRAAERLF